MDNAERYHIASQGILLVGYSSGAHLVALLGTDERYLESAGVQPSQIAASISLDVHAYDVPFALTLMVDSVVEQNMPIIRHLFGETEAEQLSGSPINFIADWAAPALVVSTDEDPSLEGSYGYIVSQAGNRYVQALLENGHIARHLHDASETHSSLVAGFGADGDLTTEAIINFLEQLPAQ